MTKCIPLLILWAFIVMTGCKNKEVMEQFSFNDQRLKWQGRTFADEDGIYLVSSAACVKFVMQGDKGRIWLQNIAPPGEYNYVSIVVDGKYTRIPVKNDSPAPYEIKAHTSADSHHVEVYKETEASCGHIMVTKLEAAGIGTVHFSSQKKIEFIGNSITAGMDADMSSMPCYENKWYDQHNAYKAYGSLAARALDLDYMLTAVSGIGVYRNSSTDFPSMNDVYEKTFLSPHPEDPPWNFKNFIPDLVCINLGTNDFADGGGDPERMPFDSSQFIDNYISLVGKVHNHYPDAKILLIQHPMSGPQYMDIFKACLEKVSVVSNQKYPGLKPVSIFSFSPFNGSGCGGHPSLEDHQRMATELIPVVKGLLI